ncbi:cell division protein FtsZ [bacterium]|nr:cell division protein FtsZ [bacterium]
MKFDLPKDQASIIKVIGVGGGGSNAVNHMYNQGINGVDFVICNTDAQALDLSPIPNKIQLGTTLTEGLGAGANPEVGKNAAIEDIEQIKAVLENNTKMVFITAGMGGGTGTGAAPVIAATAREMGILTVGIITIPFSFEGRRRKQQADEGLEALKKHVDTLLIINNDKLRVLHGNLKMGEAFAKADDVLTTASKGISEIITVAGYINTDFEDVKTVMRDGGTAIMGTGTAEGENRAIEAVQKALASPLLNDNEIKGAKNVLLNITCGDEELTFDEMGEIADFVENEAGYDANVIWGNGVDNTLGNKVSVTLIATGFGSTDSTNFDLDKKPEKVVHTLDADMPTAITQSITEETDATIEVEETIEEPTLVVREEVQPTLFEEPTEETNEVVSNEEIQDQVVFTLEDTEEIIENKRENTDVEMDTPEFSEAAPDQDEENFESFVGSTSEEIIEEVQDNVVEEETPTVTKWDLNQDEIEEPSNEEEEGFRFEVKETEEETPTETPVYTNRIPDEEQLKKSQERIMKIKALGMKMKTPSGITDLEKEPAYKRRKINLNSIPHSSENSISRFTLSDDEDGKPRLKDDNSFLHDNVD